MTYNAAEWETATVQKGRVTTTLKHDIDLAGYEETEYRLRQDKLAEMEASYDMHLDEVKVSPGDHVKEGQVLISFSSKELDDKLEESRQNKELALLKLDHISRLSALDPDRDYTEQIRLLQNECRVADYYISDIQEIYASYNIIAETDGLVVDMDQALDDGFISAGKALLKVVNDAGYYEMSIDYEDKARNISAQDFIVGDRYAAQGLSSECEVEVIAPPAERESEADKVFFRVVGGEDEFFGNVLTVFGQPEVRDNVCHVDSKAIRKSEDGTYVFVRGDDGQFRAVKVETGDSYESDVMILKGLSGGEQVALQ
ncbi:MAG: hypothetical protein J5842_03560 [Lachnospiraceae bacterium]|nr:hypothetical protein [Lachnospiraceae bacterium]